MLLFVDEQVVILNFQDSLQRGFYA